MMESADTRSDSEEIEYHRENAVKDDDQHDRGNDRARGGLSDRPGSALRFQATQAAHGGDQKGEHGGLEQSPDEVTDRHDTDDLLEIGHQRYVEREHHQAAAD